MPHCTVGGDVELHYHDHAPSAPGDEVVVLIHGQAGSHRNWVLNAPGLAAAGFRVVVPELRGHRYTKTPVGADMSITRLAADIVELLDHLGVARAHVVGWSLGGLVGQQIAHEHADRVQTLTLVNTFYDWACGPRHRRYTSVPLALLQVRVMGLLSRRTFRRLGPPIARKVLKPETRAAHPEVLAMMAEDFGENLGSSWVKRLALHTTARFSSTAWLSTLAMPTLVVAGARDHVPLWMAESMHGLLPRAELVVWLDGTHMVPMDDAAGFNATLCDFIDRARAGAVRAGARVTR